MEQKKIIVFGAVVLAVLALFMFTGSGNQSVSSNILYITQPVTSFSGKVEKISGNAVFISNQYSLPQTASVMVKVVPGQPLVMPTPQTKTITFKLLVTDKTQISQPAISVNYLLKTVNPASQAKLTIEDVKVGQMITVNSAVDLRTLKSNQFEAAMINLPQVANTLSGKIVSVTNNSLTLKAFAPVTGSAMSPGNTAAGSQEKEYLISVTSGTEISRMSYNAGTTPEESPTPPKAEKLALSDLKKDMQITVYAAEDVTQTQTLTALRIEPAQVMPSVAPPAIPSPSASTSTSPIPSASASPSMKL